MKIDPCSKCGKKGELKCEGGMVDYVKCVSCGHEGASFYDGTDFAVEAWNQEYEKTQMHDN